MKWRLRSHGGHATHSHTLHRARPTGSGLRAVSLSRADLPIQRAGVDRTATGGKGHVDVSTLGTLEDGGFVRFSTAQARDCFAAVEIRRCYPTEQPLTTLGPVGPGLLLITEASSRWPDDAARARDYVRAVVDAGVAALALATGPTATYAALPSVLASAAEAADLPLLSIDVSSPWAALDAHIDNYTLASVRLHADQQMALFTHARRFAREGTQALLEWVARTIGSWVVMTNARGTPLHEIAGAGTPLPTDMLPDAVTSSQGLAAATFPVGEDMFHLQRIRSLHGGPHYLLACVPDQASGTWSALMSVTVDLLALRLDADHALEARADLDAVNAVLFDLLRSGIDPARLAHATRHLPRRLPRSPVRLVLVRVPLDEEGAAVAWCEAAADEQGESVLVVRDLAHQASLHLLMAADSPLARTLPQALAARPGYAVGCSDAVALTEVGEAFEQAHLALMIAASNPHRLWRHNGVAPLVTLLESQPAAAWAYSLLDPLLSPEQHDLLITLRGSLERQPRLAQRLDVHHHTVRRRLQRCIQQLGLPASVIDDPRHQAMLWLACAITTHHPRPAVAGESSWRHYQEGYRALADTEPARRWASDLLRTVLADPHADDLLATVRAWIACGGIAVKTAEVLNIHPNSVAKRLDRIFRLLRRDLNGTDRHEVCIAVEVLDFAAGVKAHNPHPHTTRRA